MKREVYALLWMVLLGVIGGMGLRASTAFKGASHGIEAMALLALGFSVGRASISLLTPQLAERYGSLVAGMGFLSLASLALGYYFLPFKYYPILRILHGIFSGIAWPPMQALVISRADVNERARVSSLYFLAGTTGESMAYALGGSITYVMPLLSFVILGSIGTILVIIKMDVPKTRKVQNDKGVLNVGWLTIAGSSFSTGIINGIINSEITIEIFYKAFGRVIGGGYWAPPQP